MNLQRIVALLLLSWTRPGHGLESRVLQFASLFDLTDFDSTQYDPVKFVGLLRNHSFWSVNRFISEDDLNRCRRNLQNSNQDGNFELSPDEYSIFIDLESNGAISMPFVDMRLVLIATYYGVACNQCFGKTLDDSCCVGNRATISIRRSDAQNYAQTTRFLCATVQQAIADVLESPTTAPVTQEPTSAPVQTEKPSAAATEFPTRPPTRRPTRPTRQPTTVPRPSTGTRAPSAQPIAPSRAPVAAVDPTAVPTAEPTLGSQPTGRPTVASRPTSSPRLPTQQPSPPTSAPSETPALTDLPVATRAPTRPAPSAAPAAPTTTAPQPSPASRQPTGPTSQPSASATSPPTEAQPTSGPSESPVTPTAAPPTTVPSESPVTPTSAPSQTTTVPPTRGPTAVPTAVPVPVPSASPTNARTAPTSAPLAVPSSAPTLGPVSCVNFFYSIQNSAGFSASDILTENGNSLKTGLEIATWETLIAILNETSTLNQNNVAPQQRRVAIREPALSEGIDASERVGSLRTTRLTKQKVTAMEQAVSYKNGATRALDVAIAQYFGLEDADRMLDDFLFDLYAPVRQSSGRWTSGSSGRRKLVARYRQRAVAARRRLAYATDALRPNITNVIEDPFCPQPDSATLDCAIVVTEVCVVLEPGDIETDVQQMIIAGFQEALNNGQFFARVPPENLIR